MIAVKYGITMNCFETDIKIEYSNIFFAVQSYVDMEVGLFFATFVDNRYAKGCLLDVGVYIQMELCLFACFWLSLYAEKKYVVIQRLNLNRRQKNNIKSN